MDVRARRLQRSEEVLAVSPRAFDILALLVQRAGQTVTKAELMERVWPDVFVEEANLAQHVSQLRRLLGDTTKQPEYIATIPRQGYQFVAAVTVAEPIETTPLADDGDVRATPAETAVRPVAPSATPRRSRLTVHVLIAATVSAVIALSQTWWHDAGVRAATNPGAQAAYERGLALIARNTRQGPVLARTEFAEAVRLDPTFAPAQAQLALSIVSMYLARQVPDPDAVTQASAAAAAALALDDNLSEAHTAKGVIDLQLRDDPVAARWSLRRALALDPGNVVALDHLARALRHEGRFDESIDAARRAIALQPASVRAHMNLTQSLLFAGQRRHLEEALDVCRQAMVIDDSNPGLFDHAAEIAEAAGHLGEAVAFRAQAERLLERPDLAELLETAYRAQGFAAANTAYLEAKLAAVIRSEGHSPSTGSDRGRLLIKLGRIDEAFAALHEAVAGNYSIGVFALRHHPSYRAINADPRFPDLEAAATRRSHDRPRLPH